MPEMINYIFGNMKKTDMEIAAIRRHNRSQQKFNKRVVLLAVVTAAWIWVEDVNLKEQEKKIKKLQADMKELKGVKGE